MQLLGNLFESVLEQAGPAPERARRHQRRHGLGRRARAQGQGARERLHAFAPRAHEPLPARADVRAAGRQHLQHRDRGHVRRLPGRGEGRQRSIPRSRSATRSGAVNSINWARVVAQVVYYFKGYFAATRSNDEQVSFAVPSGNFGNIFAGYVARRMGLPIRRLVLATNENDVLDEFFRTGRYRPRAAAETHATSSPSMDISQGLQLRALHLGRGGPGRRQGRVALGAGAGEGRLRPVHRPRLGEDRGGLAASSRAQHARGSRRRRFAS